MASTSLTNTNISETYVGVLHAKGAALPELPGREDIYDGFGNKSALKVGRAGAGIDIDGTLGTSFKAAITEAIYPIGSVIFSQNDNDPGTRFTGTSWTQISKGRFIAGEGEGTDGTEFKTIPAGNDTTGKYNHKLTTPELASHRHEVKFTHGGSQSLGGDTVAKGNSTNGNDRLSNDVVQDTGSGTPHNNMPPSFGLYVWQRTS